MSNQRQSGAVSIFLVVFASLLMVVISIGFVQLMLKEQQQATANDLSQSALDAAQAGVEDGKRLLLLQQSCENGTVPGGYASRCASVSAAIASGQCNSVAAIFGVPTAKETMVQQTSADSSLQQAYTCVKIAPAFDYQGQLTKDESTIIPLKSASNFNIVKISWFNKSDVSSGATGITYPSTGANVTLPQASAWSASAPALMRTQFIQTGARFTLSDFDAKQGSGESDANTVFLYPSSVGLTPAMPPLDIANIDARRAAGGAPQPIRCNPTFTSNYACSVSIALPPYDGPVATRNAFLRLSALYNGAHFSVELYNGATPVGMSGVQSIIDATGRANDMFRRVLTRVHLTSNFIYPDAAVDVEKNFCKDFSVTDSTTEYRTYGCDPASAT